MHINATKAKLQRDEVVFGMGLDTPDPMMIEYAAMSGLDFIRIDGQQGPYTLESVEHAVRAAEAAGITPTMRLPSHDPRTVLEVLNRGVTGVTFPEVQTAADAVAAVRATRFPPAGVRALSVTAGRGMHARWALGIEEEDGYAFADREILVVCLIEDVVGIRNVEEIAAVDGVDVVTFGGADLSASMGMTGSYHHPEVARLILDGIRRARSVGKPAGLSIGSRDPAQVRAYIDAGARLLQFLPAPLIRGAVATGKERLGF